MGNKGTLFLMAEFRTTCCTCRWNNGIKKLFFGNHNGNNCFRQESSMDDKISEHIIVVRNRLFTKSQSMSPRGYILITKENTVTL